MHTDAVDRKKQGKHLEAEIERLAQFLRASFPEEVSGSDLSDRAEAVRVAIELLERLWRWEH